MRRTEQEFKEEILRRSNAYNKRRAKQRRSLLGAALCICVSFTAFALLRPDSGTTNDTAAKEPMMAAPMQESSILMIGDSAVECVPEEEPAEDVNTAGYGGANAAAVLVTSNGATMTLNPEDADVIIRYLSGAWELNATNCLCDYTLLVDGINYRYHSDCGTIQDESCHLMKLTEEDKRIVNEILERYFN